MNTSLPAYFFAMLTLAGGLLVSCHLYQKPYRIFDAAFLSESGKILVSDNQETFRLWDIKTLQIICSHTIQSQIHKDSKVGISTIAVSPDSQIMLLASNNIIRVWDLKKWREVRQLIGHTYGVTDIAVSSDNHFALSASIDSVRLWNLDNGESLRQFSPNHLIRRLVFSPDGQTALFASENGRIYLWDIQEWRLLHWFEGDNEAAQNVAFSDDGELVILSDKDHKVCVWGLKKRKQIKSLPGHKVMVTSTLLSPDHHYAVSGDLHGKVYLWDLQKNCVVRQFSTIVTTPDEYTGIQGLSFSPIEHQVLFFDGSGGSCNQDCADSRLYLWDLETGKEQSFLLKNIQPE
ncbi:MAG TPA: WD40 repeat domain-containing protein [Acidobacteriota bacterium]|nr:WD40 repeat domain-containing protein [Acidobacteriota bacterium]